MWDVIWVSKLITDTHWVPESDCLIGWGWNQELNFLQVAYINNGSIVCIETFKDRHIPGRISLEELNHVTLNVPNDNLRFEVAVSLSGWVSLVSTLWALLEFVTERNSWILDSRHRISVGLILSLIQMFLTWDQAATLCNIAYGGRVSVSVTSQPRKHIIPVLNYFLLLSWLILSTFADIFKSKNSLLFLWLVSICLLLGMSHEYCWSLRHNGSVYYDL